MAAPWEVLPSLNRARLSASGFKGDPQPRKDIAMPRRLVASAVFIAAVVVLSVRARAQDVARQPGAVYDFHKKGEKPPPAPKGDLTGGWEPATGPSGGGRAPGARAQ